MFHCTDTLIHLIHKAEDVMKKFFSAVDKSSSTKTDKELKSVRPDTPSHDLPNPL